MNIPQMLAYITAPWIRHGQWFSIRWDISGWTVSRFSVVGWSSWNQVVEPTMIRYDNQSEVRRGISLIQFHSELLRRKRKTQLRIDWIDIPSHNHIQLVKRFNLSVLLLGYLCHYPGPPHKLLILAPIFGFCPWLHMIKDAVRNCRAWNRETAAACLSSARSEQSRDLSENVKSSRKPMAISAR